MDFAPLIAAASLVYVLLNLVRYARGKDVNGVVSIISSLVIGVLVVFLLAATDFADSINLGDSTVTLGNANNATLLLVGLTFASGAGVIADVIKAVDGSQSAKKPPLVGD